MYYPILIWKQMHYKSDKRYAFFHGNGSARMPKAPKEDSILFEAIIYWTFFVFRLIQSFCITDIWEGITKK